MQYLVGIWVIFVMVCGIILVVAHAAKKNAPDFYDFMAGSHKHRHHRHHHHQRHHRR